MPQTTSSELPVRAEAVKPASMITYAMTHLDDIVALRRPELRLQDHFEWLAARSHLRMTVVDCLVIH